MEKVCSSKRDAEPRDILLLFPTGPQTGPPLGHAVLLWAGGNRLNPLRAQTHAGNTIPVSDNTDYITGIC